MSKASVVSHQDDPLEVLKQIYKNGCPTHIDGGGFPACGLCHAGLDWGGTHTTDCPWHAIERLCAPKKRRKCACKENETCSGCHNYAT